MLSSSQPSDLVLELKSLEEKKAAFEEQQKKIRVEKAELILAIEQVEEKRKRMEPLRQTIALLKNDLITIQNKQIEVKNLLCEFLPRLESIAQSSPYFDWRQSEASMPSEIAFFLHMQKMHSDFNQLTSQLKQKQTQEKKYQEEYDELVKASQEMENLSQRLPLLSREENKIVDHLRSIEERCHQITTQLEESKSEQETPSTILPTQHPAGLENHRRSKRTPTLSVDLSSDDTKSKRSNTYQQAQRIFSLIENCHPPMNKQFASNIDSLKNQLNELKDNLSCLQDETSYPKYLYAKLEKLYQICSELNRCARAWRWNHENVTAAIMLSLFQETMPLLLGLLDYFLSIKNDSHLYILNRQANLLNFHIHLNGDYSILREKLLAEQQTLNKHILEFPLEDKQEALIVAMEQYNHALDIIELPKYHSHLHVAKDLLLDAHKVYQQYGTAHDVKDITNKINQINILMEKARTSSSSLSSHQFTPFQFYRPATQAPIQQAVVITQHNDQQPSPR